MVLAELLDSHIRSLTLLTGECLMKHFLKKRHTHKLVANCLILVMISC